MQLWKVIVLIGTLIVICSAKVTNKIEGYIENNLTTAKSK